MKALALLLAAQVAFPSTPFYDGMPPSRFDRPHVMRVVYGRVDECGKPNMPGYPNAFFASCIRHNGVIYLPDPCAYGAREQFARLACHEAAHTSGWPAEHGA